jgi:hypothetical protein
MYSLSLAVAYYTREVTPVSLQYVTADDNEYIVLCKEPGVTSLV